MGSYKHLTLMGYEVILAPIIKNKGSELIFDLTIMQKEEVIEGLCWVPGYEK